jgi:hypothetical protein
MLISAVDICRKGTEMVYFEVLIKSATRKSEGRRSLGRPRRRSLFLSGKYQDIALN